MIWTIDADLTCIEIRQSSFFGWTPLQQYRNIAVIPAYLVGEFVMGTTSVRTWRSEKGRCRDVGGQADGTDQVVGLLAFLEEENKRLRDAVIDLCLENFLLRSSADF